MNIIQIDICKKELETRFGSKTSVLPLIFTFILPLIVFIPQIHQLLSSQEEGYEFLSTIFFVIIPVMITSTMGITAFISEIRWKTIKTILIAPIEIEEIFLGKCLACIGVGIIANVIISFALLLIGIQINGSILLLFFAIGPLIIIYTTFLLIIGTLKFPKIAESGGGIYFPMGGLLTAFILMFVLQIIFKNSKLMVDILSIIILGMLSLITYFSAKKLFNKEKLVLSW